MNVEETPSSLCGTVVVLENCESTPRYALFHLFVLVRQARRFRSSLIGGEQVGEEARGIIAYVEVLKIQIERSSPCLAEASDCV